jgi:hypothetical protein
MAIIIMMDIFRIATVKFAIILITMKAIIV